MLHWHIYNGGVVPLTQQLGWQTAAADKSIIYMKTLKLANIDRLLEAK